MDEKKIRQVYDTIADSWSNLRVRPLYEVVNFCNSIENKDLVLDLGCGNCRNLLPFLKRNFKCIGIDFSKGMIKELILDSFWVLY